LVVKSHKGFAAVREVMYTSQHCFDKTSGVRRKLSWGGVHSVA